MSESTVPQVRFEGFDEGWVELVLGDVSRRITNKNVDHAVEETFTNSAQYGIVTQLDYFDNSVSNPENIWGYYVVEPDDFVYNPRISSLAPFGPVKRNKLGRQGAMSPLYSVFRPSGIDYSFLEYFFETDLWHDFMRMNGDTGARHDRFSIGVDAFFRLNLSRPSSEEQRAIGLFFTHFDLLLGQHRRKHKKLQQIKVALMQRMFPLGDTDEPQLRLEGFGGAWGRQRLGDFGTTYSGLTGKTKNDFGHGAAHYVTYLDVYQHTRILDVSRCGAVEVDPKQHEVKKGDALFTVSSETPEEVGMAAVWFGDASNVYLNSFCFGFRPNIDLNSSFFAYALRSGAVRQQFELLAQGISRFNISKNKAMDIEIPLPSIPEQQAIGAIFSRLDDLISAEQQYIDKLQQVKSGLLQKIFI